MKVKTFFLIILTMIFFNNNALAKYEKLFYDFKINDVSGNELDGTAITTRLLSLYLSQIFCKSLYCFVKQQ